MRAIKDIVIHCSASPNGQRVTIEDIDRWHTERGFKRAGEWLKRFNHSLFSVGYHFVIYTSGTVATGRHLEEIGAHVQGSNAHSIGICLVGTDKFTAEQWDSLRKNITALKKMYPAARVLGHRDFSPDQNGDGILEPWEWLKTCPGFDVAAWRNAGMESDPAHIFDESVTR